MRELVERIQLKGKKVLTSDEVASAIRAIKSGRLEPGFRTDYEHVKHLGERFEGPVRDGISQGVSQGIKQLVLVGGMKVVGLLLMIGISHQELRKSSAEFMMSEEGSNFFDGKKNA